MFIPKFTITNHITNDLTIIERARGFLEAATLATEWITKMQSKALILEAHHTTHIENTAYIRGIRTIVARCSIKLIRMMSMRDLANKDVVEISGAKSNLEYNLKK
jgi:hypothetical protein